MSGIRNVSFRVSVYNRFQSQTTKEESGENKVKSNMEKKTKVICRDPDGRLRLPRDTILLKKELFQQNLITTVDTCN